MTPEQRIKRQIILNFLVESEDHKCPEMTDENIDECFEDLNENYQLQDAAEELRCSGEPTGLECEWSRHYESTAVGRQLDDGSWVGWTYWFGGGKHGEPESIDWMNEAYDLDVTSEQKLVTVHTFAKSTTA